MEFEFPDVLPTTADGLTELAEQVEAEIGVFQARHKRGDKLTNDELDTFELRIAQRGQVADAINDLADADAESAERAAALMDSLNPADPEPEADPEVEAEVEPEAEPVAEVEQPEPVAAAARQAATFGATALSNVDPNEAARPGGPQGQAVFTLQPTAPNYAKYNGPVDTRVLAEAIANDKGEFTGLRTDGPTVLATMERPWDGVVVSDFDTFVAELDRVANEIIGHGGELVARYGVIDQTPVGRVVAGPPVQVAEVGERLRLLDHLGAIAHVVVDFFLREAPHMPERSRVVEILGKGLDPVAGVPA